MTLTELQKDIHAVAVEKGWWPEGEERNIPEALCLIHSEISEALEEYRQNSIMGLCHTYMDGNKPEGFFVELADAIIRILDLAERFDVNMELLIAMKHEFNKTRPYRHGGKKA